MKFAPFQTVAEAVTTALLIAVIILNVTVVIILQRDIQTIEKQQICFATFFAQPGPSRSTSSIETLRACQPVIKAVE